MINYLVCNLETGHYFVLSVQGKFLALKSEILLCGVPHKVVDFA